MNCSVFKKDLFQGKSILITGGGSGIGLAMTSLFLQLGARVIIASRDEDRLKKAIADLGENCQYRKVDIRNEQSIDDMISSIDHIDFLVNNAGGQFPGRLEDMSAKGWRAVVDTNLNGTFLMSQAVLKNFFKSNGGKIVNITANTTNGFPLMGHTSAARAGVENLTKTMAIEWAQYGVSVNALAIGVINSTGLETYDEEFLRYIKKAKESNYTRRLGTTGEVAHMCAMLLSPISQYLVGQTISFNGGESLYHPFWPPTDHVKLKAEL